MGAEGVTSLGKNNTAGSGQSMEQLQQMVAKAINIDASGNLAAMPVDPSIFQPGIPLAQTLRTMQQSATPQDNTAVPPNANAPSGTGVSAGVNNSAVVTTPYDKAFNNVVTQLLPMTGEQIAKFREIYDASQVAAASPSGIPPKPTTTTLLVNLATDQSSPPIIRLGAGYITSLVFVDATGQPWPIDSYSVGDPNSFNIQWDRKGNTLLVQSLTSSKSSNMAILLKELNTPVMITLISGQAVLDYRVDLRIPGYGPNAVFAHSSIPDAANPVLLNILNGVAPEGSKELQVSGGECQAWLLKDTLYLRTKLNILSPAWKSVMSSIDGTRAYQTQSVPVILASQQGTDKTIKLKIDS